MSATEANDDVTRATDRALCARGVAALAMRTAADRSPEVPAA